MKTHLPFACLLVNLHNTVSITFCSRIKNIISGLSKLTIVIMLALTIAGCGERDPEPAPAPQPAPETPAPEQPAPAPEEPEPAVPAPESGEGTPQQELLPSEKLPVDWFFPPADLIPGTANGGGNTGFVMRDDEGLIIDPNPTMVFPITTGPVFLNSQTMMPGGNGLGSVRNPNPGSQNDARNYSYPWRDNFCEVRDRDNSHCNGGQGHQGQDIRPASCDNGAYMAAAPERVRIRNVGTHGVNAFGLDTGILYTFLHLDRPLATHPTLNRPVTKNDILEAGQAIGKISNKTSPDPDLDCFDRCTTLHLHFEMWSGATEFSSSFRRGADALPLPPYVSLVDSYRRLVDSEPDGEDWVSPRAPVPIRECARP